MKTQHVLAFAVVAAAAGVQAAGVRREVLRAAPPVKWDRLVESRFEADAFALLDGERPASFARTAVAATDPGKAGDGEKMEGEGHGDFDRRDMMKKLEAAEQAIAELTSSEKTFSVGASKADQHADLVIMMGKTLFSSDPDYGDDDTYLKHAEDMTNYAKQLKVVAKKGDYDAASSVFGKLKTTCNACHEGYR
jgi:cytochrome c556